MTIELEWFADGQVCLLSVSNIVSSQELQGLDQTLLQHLDAVEHKTHFIADVRSLQQAPSLVQIAMLRYPYHPRLGRSVMIGLAKNPVGRFVITTMSQVVRLPLKDFKTVEEARAYLYEMEGV